MWRNVCGHGGKQLSTSKLSMVGHVRFFGKHRLLAQVMHQPSNSPKYNVLQRRRIRRLQCGGKGWIQ